MKRSRTSEAILDTMGHKTAQVQFMVKSKLATKWVPNTVLEANAFIRKLMDDDTQDTREDLADRLHSERTLRHHMQILDSALDAHLANRIGRLREREDFLGLGFATDESPPSQVRFNGLRFQVTLVYLPLVPPRKDWELGIYDQRPPLHRESHVLDIAHCPSKHGQAVMEVLRKQFARIGCFTMDLLVGTGDGGGENEGRRGIHATLENENPGYTRKRCMGHLSWNVTKALLDAMPEVEKEVQCIAAYLSDGITWSRIRGLVTRSRADGGLGLMEPLGREAQDFFQESCGAVVDGRPESVYNILRFLGSRELVLRQAVGQDLERRNLGQDARSALEALESPQGKARRIVACELLRRCLWLHWHTLNNPHILEHMTFQGLADKWALMITNTEVDDDILERFGMTSAEFDAMDAAPPTWMDVVLNQTVGPWEIHGAA